MEAFPFVSEIVSGLAEIWSMPEERRAEAPGFDTAMEMWGTIDKAMQGQDMEPGFLEEFQKSPSRMGYDLESRLKYMLWGNPELAGLLQQQLESYKATAVASGTVTIVRGDATLVGPNAQVQQETSIDIDNIDINKYIKP